jgi:uncharacterized protein (TIGR04255 family)
MSKLPNAPLLEVIFEIKWPVDNKDLEKFQILLGEMHSQLSTDYPNVVSLHPDLQIPYNIFKNSPTHRFEGKEGEKYPLYQLGPGLLSINTIDSAYDWDKFSAEIQKISTVLQGKYNFDQNKHLSLGLKYLDFFEINCIENNLFQYLEDKFHVCIKANFKNVKNPLVLNFSTAFQTEYGILNFSIKTAQINIKQGFIIESALNTKMSAKHYFDDVLGWVSTSHEFLSNFFKEMTEGEMYKSFK